MKQAVILAAGEGRRLRPFTVNRPKAMIFIAGKPIIQYVIESLAENGVRDIILVVNYKREQIFDYIGDGRRFGVEVEYVTQREQLGTAHALAQVRNTTEEEFLVLPGDKLITPATIAEIVKSRSISILVKREEDPSRYSTVEVEKGIITDIIEPSPLPNNNLINTGIYTFHKSIFDFIKSTLDIPDVVKKLINSGMNISAIVTEQPWLDVIYPWDILTLNSAVLHNIFPTRSGTIESGVSISGQVSIGTGTVIRANSSITGPVVVGENCDIGPSVCILPATSIGNNVVLSPFNQIKGSIIGDSVHVGAGSNIEDSIIDRNCNIGGHFSSFSEVTEMRVDWQIHMVKIGAILGEGCEIKNGVVAQPGLVAGNYCQVRSLKTIGGLIPDKSIVV